MNLYPCCEHCDHEDSGLPADEHTRPCENEACPGSKPLEAAP